MSPAGFEPAAPASDRPQTLSLDHFFNLYFFVLLVLALLFCPLLYNIHNTNTHATGEKRTRNPSKRSAADPRLKTARPMRSALPVVAYEDYYSSTAWRE